MLRALITGITGQDGSYLAEFLIEKGYEVHGLKRRSSLFNTDRIDHLYQDPHSSNRNFILHKGDLTESISIFRIIIQVPPDEIYYLSYLNLGYYAETLRLEVDTFHTFLSLTHCLDSLLRLNDILYLCW